MDRVYFPNHSAEQGSFTETTENLSCIFCVQSEENGQLDAHDVGFVASDAAKGLGALKQFAALMDEGCIDDTIISNRYEKLADGDLSKDAAQMTDTDWVDTIVMGGINGYEISSYTKYPDECMEFINFATSADMIQLRMDTLTKASKDIYDAIYTLAE